MSLTTPTARALSLPPGKDDHIEFDAALGGFGVRVRQGVKGISRRWIYQYDIGPVTRRITIGDPAHMPESAARKAAAKLQAEVRLGGDPARRKTAAREEAATTMAGVLETYLPIKQAKLRSRSYGEVERHLLTVCKRLHAHPVRSITTAMISREYEAAVAKRGATTAGNAWRSLHAFFVWCLRQGLVDRNPAVGVERHKDRTRTRVLDTGEIRQLWQATADNSDYSAILRLLLISGCRASEIAGLQWSEVLTDRIVLPPARVKNGRGHVVPITPTMRAILDGRERHPGKDYIFGRSSDRPFSGWGASKEALDARLPIAPWVTHDLRRTCATHLGELGIPPHVIAAALNHVSGGGITGRVYNLAKLEEPVRNALLAWDVHMIAIVEGRLSRDKRVVHLKK